MSARGRTPSFRRCSVLIPVAAVPPRCRPHGVSPRLSPDEDLGVWRLFGEQTRRRHIVQQVTQIDLELLETISKQVRRRARKGIDPGYDIVDISHLRASSLYKQTLGILKPGIAQDDRLAIRA